VPIPTLPDAATERLGGGQLRPHIRISVFSHLSEEAHERWLEEFKQLLKPDGVLLLTTFRREMLASAEWPPVAERFVPIQQWLSAYDRGEFCYVPQSESSPHFGYTFIPEQYVRRHWPKHFAVREYIDAPTLFQSIIVCTQRESHVRSSTISLAGGGTC
jgi:hypothetical protein